MVEIGAGCGCLTVALASAGCPVLAIETDERLLPPLAEVTEGLPVEILHADAARLECWTHQLSPPPRSSETRSSEAASYFPGWASAEQISTNRGWKLVANLPYNIATPLLLDVLEDVPSVEEMLVMLQRETAERLASLPGEDAFGLPALKVSHWADAELLGRVPPAAFHPRPRVTSAILRLKRKPKASSALPITEPYALARKAYARRRQMLRRSLRGVVPAEAFSTAGVNPTARPEELSLSDWARLHECAR